MSSSGSDAITVCQNEGVQVMLRDEMIPRKTALVLFFFISWSLLHADALWADDALPLDSVRCELMISEPIFSGHEGHWDARIRERGWILKDGDLWRLWYTGYDPAQQPPVMRLGYATSADGLTWTRLSVEKPLIDDLWVEDIMVVRHEGRYLMFAEGLNDQAQLLESPDGVHWTRIGTLDVRLTDGRKIPPGPFGTPAAWRENGTWNLFYERKDLGVWLAQSSDLRVWTNVSDDPVIVPGPEEYDRLMIALNQIEKTNDRYVAVLHGTGTPQKPRQWCTFLAESRDLRTWSKIAANPIRPVSENKSSGQLVFDGQHWRLYTMHEQVYVHRVIVPAVSK